MNKGAEDRLPNEDQVLRRMLHTPPTPQKVKPAPAKRRAAKKKPERLLLPLACHANLDS